MPNDNSFNLSAMPYRKRNTSQQTPQPDQSYSDYTIPQGLPSQNMPLMTGMREASAPWPQPIPSSIYEPQALARAHLYGSASEYQNPAGPWRAPNTNPAGSAYVSPYAERSHAPNDNASVPASGNPIWQQPSPGLADYQQLSPSRSDGSSCTHVSSLPSPYSNQAPFVKVEDQSNTSPYNAHYMFERAMHSASRFPPPEHYTTDPAWARKPYSTSIGSFEQLPEDMNAAYDSDRSYDIDPLPMSHDSRMMSPDAHNARGFTTPDNARVQCETCSKTFDGMSRLQTHMNSHDPEKSNAHKCDFADCTRGFARKTDLARHQKSVGHPARLRNTDPTTSRSLTRRRCTSRKRSISAHCAATHSRAKILSPGKKVLRHYTLHLWL